MYSLKKKMLALSLGAAMIVGCAGCQKKKATGDDPANHQNPQGTQAITPEPTRAPSPTPVLIREWSADDGTYVFRDAVSKLTKCWNPHTYTDAEDGYLAPFLTDGLYDFVYNDALHPVENTPDFAGYQLIPAMAAAMPKDVTELVREMCPQYGIPEDAKEGYAFSVPLNKNACWEDGTPITAQDYVESMMRLLDPKRKNPRAVDYINGTFELAGARAYYYSNETVFVPNSTDGIAMLVKPQEMKEDENGYYVTENNDRVFFGLKEKYACLGGEMSLEDFYNAGYLEDSDAWKLLSEASDSQGFAPVTKETVEAMCALLGTEEEYGFLMTILNVFGEPNPAGMGLFAQADDQLTIVLEKPISMFALCYQLTGNWLVYAPFYDRMVADADGSIHSVYNTSVGTTKSYGPYRLAVYKPGEMLKLVKNENWYGYSDKVHAVAAKEDGVNYRLYQTDVLECYQIPDAQDRLSMFLLGNLTELNLTGTEQKTDPEIKVYSEPSDTVYYLYLNANKEQLDRLEESADFDNTRLDWQTLSLQSFRKALSLAISREAFTEEVATGRGACYGIVGDSFLWNTATGETYRNTKEAEAVLSEIYGVDRSEAALKTTIKQLASRAFEEACEAGFLTDTKAAGQSDQKIVIEYAVANASTLATDTVAFWNERLAEAFAGTPFEGKVEFALSKNFGNDWKQRFCDGYSGAVMTGWSSSMTDPYAMVEFFTNPTYQYNNGWFDTSKKMLTLSVAAKENESKKELTQSIRGWAQALCGTETDFGTAVLSFGEEAPTASRLTILAALEKALLQEYDVLPIMQSAGHVLLSDQVQYMTENYHPIMLRGGIVYLRYRYTDEEWQKMREKTEEQNGENSTETK